MGCRSKAMLEGSNVDLGMEMADMINIQRSLQFQSRAITYQTK